MLDIKSHGGNVALKLDVRKAFDTLDWNFLLKVLSAFGFNSTFCDWIKVILASAHLSVSVNGHLVGFFPCKRGVRQGDPLSPLLFCIAEDVLSRGITHLSNSGALRPMASPRGFQTPTHVLYADDILIFCSGHKKSLTSLMSLLNQYSEASGQLLGLDKCRFYSGAVTAGRCGLLRSFLGFASGTLPFNYLGVPIFKGRPKALYLRPIADRIKSKLSTWKGSLLSIMGRVQLVKSVIHGMLTYSFHIYAWPVSLLKTLDTWIKNFIWSGNADLKKLTTVAWSKVCSPTQEGGLGVRSLRAINESAMTKLTFDMLSSRGQWASFIRARFYKRNIPVSYHVRSSLWPSLRAKISTVLSNSTWNIGDGSQIYFWTDNWLSKPLSSVFSFPLQVQKLLTSKVSDYIKDFNWHLPMELQLWCPTIYQEIINLPIPRFAAKDILAWDHSSSGLLSSKDAYEFLNPSSVVVSWAKEVWRPSVPPSKSFIFWRAAHDRLPTDDNLKKRGCTMVSICCHCGKNEETTSHLFLTCPFAQKIWQWLQTSLNCLIDTSSILSVFSLLNGSWSDQVSDVLAAAVIHVISNIWLSRNKLCFDNKAIPLQSLLHQIKTSISLSGSSSKGHMFNTMAEFSILKFFRIKGIPKRDQDIIQVDWKAPLCGWFKCNTDGASKGSPGPSSCGGIFRDYRGSIVGCFASFLGNATALDSELQAAMIAIETAVDKGWRKIWLECDSSSVVAAFKNAGIVPWRLRNRWGNTLRLCSDMSFIVSHIFREGNSCADKLAAFGLVSKTYSWWSLPPSFILDDFCRNRQGLPFFRFR